jgi:hypothetical protein
VVSPACRSFFHIVRVQFKISLEEMRNICRRLGAGRPPLWQSPAWELQVVRRQLCFSTVDFFRFSQRSPAGAWLLALYMLQHGHRTAPL